MSPQQRAQLASLLQQLAQTPSGPKDEEVATLVGVAVAHRPDTAYLLARRTLLLMQALHAAHAEMAQVKQQIEQVLATRTRHVIETRAQDHAAAARLAANAATYTAPASVAAPETQRPTDRA
jgi:hypothetical protein